MTTFDDTELIMTPEEEQLANQMNQAIGVYIPAGVRDETDIRLYHKLFSFFRQMYFIYNMIMPSDILETFTEFYHADYTDKIGILNRLENKILYYFNQIELNGEAIDEYLDNKMVEQYIQEQTPLGRASIIFYNSRGRLPELGEDMTRYLDMVTQVDHAIANYEANYYTAIDEYQKQLEQELSGNPDQAIIEAPDYQPDATPQDVVSRYLKGSGMYDPALRNTGFRVDTDIEKPHQES